MARAASDMGIPARIEAMIPETMSAEEVQGFAGLLDALAERGMAELPLEGRTQLLHGTADADPEAKAGLQGLKQLVTLLFYALPDERGRNPNWEAIGYPGPISAPPLAEEAPKTITVAEVEDDATLEADVCVVGSGAGGSVIAARLAEAGRSVLVLEMGGYRNEQDFKQLELVGMQELYYGGGLVRSESGSINVLAGSTLGGGTVVNYMNCIRTPERIRREWAELGLEGVDHPDYEARIDAVAERLGANTEATKQNNTHQRLMEGLDARGLEHRPIVRNATLNDDPVYCGYCPTGCQQGCKRSAMKTWLQDASDAGARAVVGCRVERVVCDGGRATGVEATVTRPDGSPARLVVEAPTVVVACGSVESPALLLRSGIGGPAVGKNLRLHPAYVTIGVYDEPIEGWTGQIQSLVSDEFDALEDGFGFLLEGTGVFPGLFSGTLPWEDGAAHKELMQTLRWQAPFISVARDHGAGEVVLDPLGRAVVRWGLDDPVDARLAVRANVELAKLHQAAGARQIVTGHTRAVRWRHGEDFDAFLEAVEGASYAPNDVACFTAHQMGACRMGADPQTSVADGRGQLHDTRGVWIGDASAFPTAPGVNPMVSIMALAHRTADMIAEAA
ncbi:MAG: FAD-dependent oxidoreductase [Thermoleophilaceae bacterium]|nr:FAD-dependent oxidoreductase [Thermoleophilaceae bacterium]